MCEVQNPIILTSRIQDDKFPKNDFKYKTNNQLIKDIRSSKHKTKEDISEPDNGHKIDDNCIVGNLTLESERLKTFKNWPNPAVSPEELAKAGFYYLGQEDFVRCAFCQTEGHKWRTGDDPMLDHTLWSPSCPFIRKIPGDDDLYSTCSSSSSDESSDSDQDVCGSRNLDLSSPIDKKTCRLLKSIGLEKSKPCAFEEYTTYESRLETFKTWPKSLKQTPSQLAEAGFFYTGRGDHTLCFCCSGGLKDWDDDDDPWEQHALWFRRCDFLLLKKGPAYIEEVDKKIAADNNSVPSTSSKSCSTKETAVVENKACETATVSTAPENNMLCKICYKNELGVIFLPCGHVVACIECSLSLKNICPVCRKRFEATTRAFIS